VYLNFTATSSSLQDFDYKRINESYLRIALIQIGVESFSKQYTKLGSFENTKKLVKTLTENGIGSWLTMMFGFDHHNHDNVWEEIHKLTELNAVSHAIFNIMPLPKTPLWDKLKEEKRLLKVPLDFYYKIGFQAFIHPHFKPGFEDVLPLMYNFYKYIDKEVGFSLLQFINIYENLPNRTDALQKRIDQAKVISSLLFDSWKQNFGCGHFGML
jgi:radical SAM superfamily enzyme YgiQ (UPF0313 family)